MQERDQVATEQRETLSDETPQEKETGRIEAFSDGIFAVAITLLVLNIQVPHGPNGAILAESALGPALLSQWPVYLAFLTSFATIGIMWLNHHRLFNYIKSSNSSLIGLNLLLLLFIVLTPFPTALLADYLQIEAPPGLHIPTILYSGFFVLLAISFNLLWRYAAAHNRLLDKKADPEQVRAITRQYSVGPLLYLIAFGLAFLYPPLSIIWNLLLAIFFALPGEVILRLLALRRRKI